MSVPARPDPDAAYRNRVRIVAEQILSGFLGSWFLGQRARVIARLLAADRLSIGLVRDLLPASENVGIRIGLERVLAQVSQVTVQAEIGRLQPNITRGAQPIALTGAPRVLVVPIRSAPAALPAPASPPPPIPPSPPGVQLVEPIPPRRGPSRQPVTRYLQVGQRPNVTELIDARVSQSARRVVQINAVTRRAIREQLRIGIERGYSRLQIAAGEPADGYRGIGAVVEETYHNRPLTIARTEIATVTNRAVVEAAGLMGYARVRVFDGDECGWLSHDDPIKPNGQLYHVRAAYLHPIAHPNCRRRFYPEETADALGSRADGTRVQ